MAGHIGSGTPFEPSLIHIRVLVIAPARKYALFSMLEGKKLLEKIYFLFIFSECKKIGKEMCAQNLTIFGII